MGILSNKNTISDKTSGRSFLGIFSSLLISLFAIIIFFSSFGIIETGNVGVRTTLGTVSMTEITPGVYLKWPIISSVEEVTAKEVDVVLVNMTPKARDNLSLKDMDVSVFYRTDPTKIAELMVQFSGQTTTAEFVEINSDMLYSDGPLAAGYQLVRSISREAVYNAVSDEDSLSVHTNRERIALAVQQTAQQKLDAAAKDAFIITRVVVRQAITDPSIENSIRIAVENQKKLEAMKVAVEIAEKEAEIEITKARGIAEAQRIISGTLTREYLAHERNEALKTAAEKGTLTTMVVPEGASPLLSLGK
jgi:regulator of protease activity HflC (stomatin/prohibitin superfamily)